MAVPEMRQIIGFTELHVSGAVSTATAELASGFDYNRYRSLHMALLKGDWETTRMFFDDGANALTAKVTPHAMTALQVAAAAGQWRLVENLVQRMPPEALAVQDLYGCTALHYVAMGGSTRVAKALLIKNPSLTQITNSSGQIPLLLATTTTTNKELIWCLALATTDENPSCPFSGSSSCNLVAALTTEGHHDIMLYLLQLYPHLAAISDENGNLILNALSKSPSHFRSGTRFLRYEGFIYEHVPVELEHSSPSYLRGDLEDPQGNLSNHQSYFVSLLWKATERVPVVKRLRDMKVKHQTAVRLAEYVYSKASNRDNSELLQSFASTNILLNAASSGNVEILKICFKLCPHLVWNYIPNEGYLLQIAIRNRQAKVFSLICRMPICKNFISVLDESQNTISHLAASLGPSPPPECAAIQLQKELQWFKEVEKLDHPSHKEAKNKDGKTPSQLFKDEHKGMLEQATKWMKDTSWSLIPAATLIATIAFAVAFAVPGGNDQNTGIPLLLRNEKFESFVTLVAISFTSSLISLILFLSVLTASYVEEDFLKRLPSGLILGAVYLLLAILATTFAFAFSLSLVLQGTLEFQSSLLIDLCFCPVIIFELFLLPLFVKIYFSTYGSTIYHPQSLW